MAITFECPSCCEPLSAAESEAGQVVRCPTCHKAVTVPGDAPIVEVAEVVAEPEVPLAEVAEEPKTPVRRATVTGAPRKGAARPPARRAGKPAGRGPLFWVLIALSGAVLLMGLAFAGIYYAVWMPRWREHNSFDGYQAEFPAAPRDDMRDRLADPLPGTLEGTLLILHRETYLVRSVNTLGPRPGVSQDALAQEAVDALLRAFPGAVVVSTNPIGVSDFPGREVVLEGSDQWGGVARVVVAETRTYTLVVGGPGVTPDGPRARRFLDSFRVTAEELFAKRTQRLESERRVVEAIAAERRQREEAERQVAEQKRVVDEAEAKQRQSYESVKKERENFRSTGADRLAPDPYLIPGLVLHLGFDGPDRMWPKSAGKFYVSEGTAPGPGSRGPGLYLPRDGSVAISEPSQELRRSLDGPVTVAGWVKLRYRPVTLFQFHLLPGHPSVHLSVDGKMLQFATGRDSANRGGGGDNARDPGVVNAPWVRDEQWHHVAAVREFRGKDEWAVLYLDGVKRAEAADRGESWFGVTWLRFAVVGEVNDKKWTGPTGPRTEAGGYSYPGREEMVCAVDEICIYNRSLTAAEVRVLAGVDQVPGDIAKKERPAAPVIDATERIVLTPAAESLPALVGIAFDPARKAAWAVTARRPAELIRLSYPELVEQSRYRLPGRAGPVAFDAPENALFVAVRVDGGFEAPLDGGWPGAGGAVHRYNLADLPAAVPGAVPEITPTAEAKLTNPERVTALAVTPDGQWVYGMHMIDPRGGPLHGRLFRLPADLQTALNSPAMRLPPGATGFPFRLGIPTIESAVWYPSPSTSGEWTRVNLRTGAGGRVSFGPDPGRTYDWAIHPDGDRVFVPDKGHLIELRPVTSGPPADGQRLLIPGIHAESWKVRIGLTADGRFLFCSRPNATPAEDRLTVVETDPNAAPPLMTTLAGELNSYSVPFWVAPDGAVVVFLSGRIVRVGYPAGRSPRAVTRAERLAVAPLPRRVGHTAPPTDIPGLTFYLPLDDREGEGVREVVSGKVVGKVFDAEFVDGVRGRAARLRADVKSGGSAGLDLKDQLAAVRFAADQPFTIGVWMRVVEGNGGGAFSATRKVGKVGGADLGVGISLAPKPDPMLTALVREWPDVPKPKVTYAGENRFVKERQVWRHVAIIRDAAGQVRVVWDGVTSSQVRPFAFATEYDTFGLGTGAYQDGIDVDEFCIFNRALSDDELRKLAGVR